MGPLQWPAGPFQLRFPPRLKTLVAPLHGPFAIHKENQNRATQTKVLTKKNGFEPQFLEN